MVEHQPSKLRVAGSNPVSRSSLARPRTQRRDTRERFAGAHVAQSVEHLHGKQAVSSSILLVGSSSFAGWFDGMDRDPSMGVSR